MLLVTTLKHLMNAPDVIPFINTDLIEAMQLNFFLINFYLRVVFF